jgi:Uma2 family endonuclease
MVAQKVLQQQTYLSPEEYLAQEATAKAKSEYLNGVTLLMAGASLNHNYIVGNLYFILHLALRKQNYNVLMSDVRLWIAQRKVYTYPDLMVIAGLPECVEGHDDTIVNPLLLVEVLSESTKNYDRGEKFAFYRTIPTFQEYILVEQTSMHVEQYTKTLEGKWLLSDYDDPQGSIALASVPVELALAEIYERVSF